jgi:hypothetical protein
VIDLARMGDRWRAEVRTARATVVVAGLAGAGIPAATLREGAPASVVGVVRRPHPSASDRRFAVAPRGPSDVDASATAAATAGSPTAGASSASLVPGASGPRRASGRPGEAANATVDADLATLATLVGSRVRVGGLVVALDRDRIVIDDGTATGRIRLVGEAATLLPLLEPGDAVGAAGRVVSAEGAAVVEVAVAADLVRLGDLGEALALQAPVLDPVPAGSATDPRSTPNAAAGRPMRAGVGDGPLAVAAVLGVLLACAAAALVVGRWRRRGRLAARIAARLDALAAPAQGVVPASPGAGPTGNRGASVREPA